MIETSYDQVVVKYNEYKLKIRNDNLKWNQNVPKERECVFHLCTPVKNF